MGLLDDAIREHLELKRRSGADPGAIAQAEQDALDPIFPEEPRAGELDGAPFVEGSGDEHVAAEHLAADGEEFAGAAAQPGPIDAQSAAQPEEPDFSTVGQETAELDMRTVLEQDTHAASGPAGTPPPRATSTVEQGQGEELEWEVANSRREPMPEEIPGQERLTFE